MSTEIITLLTSTYPCHTIIADADSITLQLPTQYKPSGKTNARYIKIGFTENKFLYNIMLYFNDKYQAKASNVHTDEVISTIRRMYQL